MERDEGKFFYCSCLLLLPASKLPYLGKQSEPRENARTRGLSPAFSRDSLHLARVASVSNRAIARKIERKQKKKACPIELLRES